jgi:Ca2+-binding RTX toxin-like protein
MGIEFLFWAGLFAASLAGSVLFGGETATPTAEDDPPEDTTTPETDPETSQPSMLPRLPAGQTARESSGPDDLYDPEAYTREQRLDDTANLVAGGEAAGAYFLEAGDDTLDAGPAGDFASGGAGADLMRLHAGADIGFGGDGNDTIDGGDGNDLVWGDEGADLLFGRAGNDTLWGGAGDDTLLGGEGSDALFGGDGNDYLSGQVFGRADQPLWADTLSGGAGNDTILMARADIATGGEGADLFVLEERSGANAASRRIDDFDPALDRIEVLYLPETGVSAPVVSVQPVGADTYQVLLDGVIVALVTSTGGAVQAAAVLLTAETP